MTYEERTTMRLMVIIWRLYYSYIILIFLLASYYCTLSFVIKTFAEDTLPSRLTHAELPRSSTADGDGAIAEFYRQPGYWRNG